MMNIEKAPVTDISLGDLTMADKWILSKANTLAKDVTENLDKYELGIALQKVYDFIWEEFCDWYIEMVKPDSGRTGTPPSRGHLDAEDRVDPVPQASAPLHAVHHRGDFLQPSGRGGEHHDFLLAGV